MKENVGAPLVGIFLMFIPVGLFVGVVYFIAHVL